jgi:hypothetical protein
LLKKKGPPETAGKKMRRNPRKEVSGPMIGLQETMLGIGPPVKSFNFPVLNFRF